MPNIKTAFFIHHHTSNHVPSHPWNRSGPTIGKSRYDRRRLRSCCQMKNSGPKPRRSSPHVLSSEVVMLGNGSVAAIWGWTLKWWVSPTTTGFPTKNDHFGVFWGYHHLRKHPYILRWLGWVWSGWIHFTNPIRQKRWQQKQLKHFEHQQCFYIFQVDISWCWLSCGCGWAISWWR